VDCVVQTQMRKGFERVEGELPDLKLDHPKAPELLAAFKEQALKEGWLTLEPAPEAPQ
jgi:hypothetical protein